MSTNIEFDPTAFAAVQDRYPIYQALRDEHRVLRAGHSWILTRYEDVSALLRDPQSLVKPPGGSPAGLRGVAAELHGAQLVLSDPPVHDRLRRLASPTFTQQAIAPLQSWIESMISARIDALAERETFDAIGDLAAYVPAATILHILGIPDRDWEPLIARVPGFLHIFSPFPLGEEELAACEASCAYYIDYFGAIVDARQANPGDDIVGKLVTAHVEGDRLSRLELVAMLQAFLNAGFETTMSTLGAGMWGMLSQRRPWETLAADPSLAGHALEETLRWDPPIHFLQRFPAKDLVIDGTTIRAGEAVQCCLAAANRDERRFPDPDVIDIARADKAHVTFGGGRHFCIGALLAKMQARITLATLAQRMPELELVTERPERQVNLLFHAIKRLDVRVNRPRAAR